MRLRVRKWLGASAIGVAAVAAASLSRRPRDAARPAPSTEEPEKPTGDAKEAKGTFAKGEEGSMGRPVRGPRGVAASSVGGLLEADGHPGDFGSGHGRLGGGNVFGTGLRASSEGEGSGSAMGQRGGVRAGEWDDNTTLRELRRLIGASASPLEPLDVSIRRVLVARDSQGKALASCPVDVVDGQGNAVTLRTTASGRALLFPRAEGLGGSTLAATVRCGGNVVTRSFDIGSDDGIVKLDGREPRDAPTGAIDVAIALDTTGSMGEEIAAVESTLRSVLARTTGVRVGLVEYKDRVDAYVTRVFDMTDDVARLSTLVSGLAASGGGDYPEAVTVGIHDALTRLAWNPSAPARLLFVIGDAPPHAHDTPSYADEARRAAHAGIQVFTIAASGMDAFGQMVFRQLAQYTGGTEMFVLRGGAGPQSVGGGDPIKSCGGTQTRYTSGHLDALILRKIEGARAALEGDPLAVRGVGADVATSCP